MDIATLSQVKREKLVSTIKMLTGLEAEIVGDSLQIKAGELTGGELDRLVKYCRKVGLEHEIIGDITFKIY